MAQAGGVACLGRAGARSTSTGDLLGSYARDGEPTGQIEYLGRDVLRHGLVALRLEDARDERADALHLRLFHSARRDGGSADADPRGDAGLLGVVGNRVFVHGDSDGIERLLGLLSGEIHRPNIHQHEVVVGPARDDAKTRLRKRCGERARVHADLLRVGLELGRRGLLQHDRLRGDHVHERAALNVGEDRAVDRLRELRVREDHAAAWTAEGLVRRRRHDLRVADRSRVLPRRDETGEVRHVHEEQRLDRVGDLPQPREIEDARIRRRAGDDELRAVLLRDPLELVVIQHLVVLANSVRGEVVELAREVHRRAVRQVTALMEGETQHRVSRFEDRGVRGHVRLRAGMRLDVGVRRAKERFCTLDRERLGAVAPLAPAVVAAAGVALRVLVRENAARGLHDRRARVVLRGDELDLLDLPAPLVFDRAVDLGINAFETAHKTPLFMPCVRSATTGSVFSSFAICWRRRSCRPLWTFAPRYASTLLLASPSPITPSRSVSTLTSPGATPSRADHSFSTTPARTPAILFAATAGPMPEPQKKMPRSTSPRATASARGRTIKG